MLWWFHFWFSFSFCLYGVKSATQQRGLPFWVVKINNCFCKLYKTALSEVFWNVVGLGVALLTKEHVGRTLLWQTESPPQPVECYTISAISQSIAKELLLGQERVPPDNPIQLRVPNRLVLYSLGGPTAR